MTNITLRANIGIPLTNKQMDDNFSNLNDAIVAEFNRASLAESTMSLTPGAKGDKGDPGDPGAPGAPGAPGGAGPTATNLAYVDMPNTFTSSNVFTSALTSESTMEFKTTKSQFPQIKMRDASGGGYSYYDNTDPDSGIYNYSMLMDAGYFQWHLSTVNTAYHVQPNQPVSSSNTAKMGLDGQGNLTIAGVLTQAGTNSSLAASGYQKFPGGLIIQWGSCLASGPVSFPIAFPNSCFSVAGSGHGNFTFSGNAWASWFSLMATNLTPTGFSNNNPGVGGGSGGVNNTQYYIAIGN